MDLIATSSNEVDINDNGETGILVVGAYGGSKRSEDGKTTIGKQYVNPDQAEKIEQNGGNTAGQFVKHEIMESYNAMNIGKGTHTAKTTEGNKTYFKAHKKTMRLDPKYSDKGLKKDLGISVPGYNIYFHKNESTGSAIELFRIQQ